MDGYRRIHGVKGIKELMMEALDGKECMTREALFEYCKKHYKGKWDSNAFSGRLSELRRDLKIGIRTLIWENKVE